MWTKELKEDFKKELKIFIERKGITGYIFDKKAAKCFFYGENDKLIAIVDKKGIHEF